MLQLHLLHPLLHYRPQRVLPLQQHLREGALPLRFRSQYDQPHLRLPHRLLLLLIYPGSKWRQHYLELHALRLPVCQVHWFNQLDVFGVLDWVLPGQRDYLLPQQMPRWSVHPPLHSHLFPLRHLLLYLLGQPNLLHIVFLSLLPLPQPVFCFLPSRLQLEQHFLELRPLRLLHLQLPRSVPVYLPNLVPEQRLEPFLHILHAYRLQFRFGPRGSPRAFAWEVDPIHNFRFGRAEQYE